MQKISEITFNFMESRLNSRIESGELVEDKDAILKCHLCKKKCKVIPARHWGQEVPNYYMAEKHRCVDEDVIEELSTETRKYAEFVILAKGYQVFITKEEKDAYISAMQLGRSKGIHIREYFVDGLYTVIPFYEWKATEERRGNQPPDYVAI